MRTEAKVKGIFRGKHPLSSFFEVLFLHALFAAQAIVDVEAIQAYMEQPLMKGLNGNMRARICAYWQYLRAPCIVPKPMGNIPFLARWLVIETERDCGLFRSLFVYVPWYHEN